MPSGTVQNYTIKQKSTPEGPVALPQIRQLLMVDLVFSNPNEHEQLDESYIIQLSHCWDKLPSSHKLNEEIYRGFNPWTTVSKSGTSRWTGKA